MGASILSADTISDLGAAFFKAGAPGFAGMLGTLATAAGTALGGPLGGAAGALVGAVVKDMAARLGVDPTPEAVVEKMETDPAGSAQAAREVEAEHSQALSGELQAMLADVANARALEATRIQAGMVWATATPHVLAYSLLATFVSVLGALYFKGLPESNIAMMLVGALISEFRGALAYFFGTSESSRHKNEIIGLSMAAAAPTIAREMEIAAAAKPSSKSASARR